MFGVLWISWVMHTGYHSGGKEFLQLSFLLFTTKGFVGEIDRAVGSVSGFCTPVRHFVSDAYIQMNTGIKCVCTYKRFAGNIHFPFSRTYRMVCICTVFVHDGNTAAATCL